MVNVISKSILPTKSGKIFGKWADLRGKCCKKGKFNLTQGRADNTRYLLPLSLST